MARPMSWAAQQFVEQVRAQALPSFEVAHRIGLPESKAGQIASNLLRAERLEVVDTIRRDGACRPVAVYRAIEPQAERPEHRAWFVDLGELCR